MEHRRANSTDDKMFSQQSLLTALNRFVKTVNSMDDIVMIPSRLRDFEDLNPGIVQEHNENILSLTSGRDLHRWFCLLHSIRDEIIDGSIDEIDDQSASVALGVEEGNNDKTTTATRKTASLFRFHLRGLYSMLHQLTETANYLGNRYERDICLG